MEYTTRTPPPVTYHKVNLGEDDRFEFIDGTRRNPRRNLIHAINWSTDNPDPASVPRRVNLRGYQILKSGAKSTHLKGFTWVHLDSHPEVAEVVAKAIAAGPDQETQT